MKEYIEREAVLRIIDKYGCGNGSVLGYHSGAVDCAGSEIARIPAADVVEVRHAKWYRHDKVKHGDTCYYCSACEKMALSDGWYWELTNYCPNCGAKMERTKEE